MLVLSNPIIGISASFSNLILNRKGLHYKVDGSEKSNFESSSVLITDNYEEVMDIFKIDHRFGDLETDIDECFDILLNSNRIRSSRFVHLTEKTKDIKLAVEYNKYLKKVRYGKDFNKETYVSRLEKISIIELIDYNPNLIEEIRETKRWLENKRGINKKFNGGEIIKRYPNIDKTQFNTNFVKFRKSFETEKSLGLFIIDNSIDDICKKYHYMFG